VAANVVIYGLAVKINLCS